MKKNVFLFIALLAFVATACNTSKQRDILAENIDTTINPADDFFAYANGFWLKHNPIPGDETSWGIGQLVNEEIYSRKLKINEAAAHFNQLTQGLGAGLVPPIGAKVDRLEHLFEDRVARALKSLGLPTAQEVAELQERVAALESALEAALKTAPSQSGTAKTARKTPARSKKSAT